ncbi:MAG: DnaJ domain-containing protein [Dehalococcoidia bacterium]|jgi:curved DNA-binding protein CbpA
MSEFVDYYEVLQVSPMAEDEVIDAAYKKLAQKYHPDKNPASAERMKAINNAYDILGNNEKRKIYHTQWLKEKSATSNTTEKHTKPPPNSGIYQFLIEYRLRDSAKEYARDIIFDIARKFGIAGSTNFKGYAGHPRNRALPPHTVLYGTATTKDIDKVKYTIDQIVSKYTLVPFRIDKKLINLHNKAICLTITPSRQLEELRWELAKELNKFCNTKPYDLERSFVFHITIANDRDPSKISKILKYINPRSLNTFNLHVSRLTVLEDGSDSIICEYDLIFRKWLTGEQAIDPNLWNKTIERLNAML